MTDYTELKAKAEIDAQCNERFTNISPSDLLELIDELLCPACKGSGEGWVMSDSGPDAHHIQADCPTCSGQGTMIGACKTMKAQRDNHIDRVTQDGGELFFMRIERDRLMAEVESLTIEADQLHHESARFRKNSDRYCWLRDMHIGDDPESINLDASDNAGLDSAIDAAMSAGE